MVLNFLREQGFLPQVDESNNIEFKFQMASFVFIENDDDPDFFQLLLPNIYDVTEDNRDIVLETVNKVNQSMKVAKACVVENSVWVFFETILDSTPDVSDIIPRALRILQSTMRTVVRGLGGQMKLTHVNDDIFDILKMTGFTRHITVERV